jgi:phage gpG-like protein
MAERVVTITGDKKLVKKLNALTKQAKNPTPIHKRIGLKAMGDVNQQFRKEGKEFGKAWKPLKPSTVAMRRKGSSRVLRDTGRMAQSLNFRADKRSAKIGFASKIAEFHQFGTRKDYPITPKKARVLAARHRGAQQARAVGLHVPKNSKFAIFGKKVKHPGLPARPMLPMGNDLNRYMKRKVIPLVEAIIARTIR